MRKITILIFVTALTVLVASCKKEKKNNNSNYDQPIDELQITNSDWNVCFYATPTKPIDWGLSIASYHLLKPIATKKMNGNLEFYFEGRYVTNSGEARKMYGVSHPLNKCGELPTRVSLPEDNGTLGEPYIKFRNDKSNMLYRLTYAISGGIETYGLWLNNVNGNNPNVYGHSIKGGVEDILSVDDNLFYWATSFGWALELNSTAGIIINPGLSPGGIQPFFTQNAFYIHPQTKVLHSLALSTNGAVVDMVREEEPVIAGFYGQYGMAPVWESNNLNFSNVCSYSVHDVAGDDVLLRVVDCGSDKVFLYRYNPVSRSLSAIHNGISIPANLESGSFTVMLADDNSVYVHQGDKVYKASASGVAEISLNFFNANNQHEFKGVDVVGNTLYAFVAEGGIKPNEPQIAVVKYKN